VVPADRAWDGADSQRNLGKKGYTLADRGTYLALKKNLSLDILAEGDAILLNVYHVIEVNPQVAQGERRRGEGFCRFHGIQ